MARSAKPTHEDLDCLFAYIAMTLWPGLSSGAREVGGAILSHYNWKTGQCDPSLGRLAKLTGLDRKTVTNALLELTCPVVNLFDRVRHGGKGRRTAYFPNFKVCRDFVREWNERLLTGAAPAKTAKIARREIRESIDEQLQKIGMEDEFEACDHQGKNFPSNCEKISPLRGENSPPKPLEITNKKNQLKKDVSEDKTETASNREHTEGQGKPGGKSVVQRHAQSTAGRRRFGLSSNIAADESAKQRWVAELTRTRQLERLISDIDEDLASRATAAERVRRGSGAKIVIDALMVTRASDEGDHDAPPCRTSGNRNAEGRGRWEAGSFDNRGRRVKESESDIATTHRTGDERRTYRPFPINRRSGGGGSNV